MKLILLLLPISLFAQSTAEWNFDPVQCGVWIPSCTNTGPGCALPDNTGLLIGSNFDYSGILPCPEDESGDGYIACLNWSTGVTSAHFIGFGAIVQAPLFLDSIIIKYRNPVGGPTMLHVGLEFGTVVSGMPSTTVSDASIPDDGLLHESVLTGLGLVTDGFIVQLRPYGWTSTNYWILESVRFVASAPMWTPELVMDGEMRPRRSVWLNGQIFNPNRKPK